MKKQTVMGCLVLSLILGIFAGCGPADHPETANTNRESVHESETDPESGTSAVPDSVTDTEREETAATTDPESDTEPETEPTDDGLRSGQEVRVVSFNLDANESTIGARSKSLIQTILSYEPDSFGVQECRGSWTGILHHRMKGKYGRVGVDAGGNPEAVSGWFATYIFYREDKFRVVDSGTFWLSRTPDVPSKYSDTVDCNRTCTWAILEDRHTGFRYVHMNSHLDWMDRSVTGAQVEMIRDQILRFEAMGYPVFATGDYNTDEQSEEYQRMLTSDHVADAKFVAEKTMSLGTYPDYGEYDVTVEKPIDFCFVTGGNMKVLEYHVIDDRPDGKYVSDHNGLFIHASVPALPDQERLVSSPAFAEKPTAALTGNGQEITVTIPQAKDRLGAEARFYRIDVTDADGKPVLSEELPSGLLRHDTPAQVTFSFRLSEAGHYTVTVTPVSMMGMSGEPARLGMDIAGSVKEEFFGETADLVDVSVENGQIVDHSPGQSDCEALGQVTLDERGMTFRKAGNVKIPGFRTHYRKLPAGFTLETVFTTGKDVNTYQSVVSNMHAGGFGIDMENGRMQFSVYAAGNYIGSSSPVKPDTTYHLVGVFDGSSVQLYVNGEPSGKTAVTEQMGVPTDAGASYLCIGADSDATGQGEYLFEGTVRYVRMFTAVPSDGQVLYLFHHQS